MFAIFITTNVLPYFLPGLDHGTVVYCNRTFVFKSINATSTQSEINLTAKEIIFVTCSTATERRVEERAYIYLECVAYGV